MVGLEDVIVVGAESVAVSPEIAGIAEVLCHREILKCLSIKILAPAGYGEFSRDVIGAGNELMPFSSKAHFLVMSLGRVAVSVGDNGPGYVVIALFKLVGEPRG